MLMVLGYLMVATFMALIMTRRLSALAALILVPVAFGIAAGFGPELGPMAIDGLTKLAPTAALLLFAVLFFSVMMQAGLFAPLVDRLVAFAGDDPVRIVLASTAMATIVSLDGDGATTVLIVFGAFLPIYHRLQLNPMILGVVVGCANTVINLAPWGGPTGRASAAVGAEMSTIFVPLLPAMAAGVAATFAIAWHLGRSERARLATIAPASLPVEDAAEPAVPVPTTEELDERRPSRLRYTVNLALTLAVLASALLQLLPLALGFMIGLALALIVNFRPEDQAQRLARHAENALPIVTLILAAGVFTGILSGTGMVKAMAEGLTALVPEEAGPFFGPIVAVLSIPLTFVLSNDAYYFGILPVLAETAAQHGVDPATVARASLLSQPTHALSPLVAALYLVTGLMRVDVGAYQRFALKWALLLTFIMIAVAALTGAIV